MENSEQNPVLQNSLSYKRADELFLQELGRKCGGHKFNQILKDLINSEQIIKTGNYQSKLKGNCYRTIRDDEEEQKEVS